MKSVNLKISVIALAIGVFAVSCGGGGSKQQSGNATETKTEKAAKSSGAELKDVNDGNWQAVVKANFGLDLAVPAGWTFKEVRSPTRVNNLVLTLTIGEGTTADEEGKRLFEATKVLSPKGNLTNKADWKAETVSAGDAVNDYSEADTFKDGDANANWCYIFNSRKVMVLYIAAGNQAEYTFVLN